MTAYFESGFCVRQPSWHGQETLLADYPEDWDAARDVAGLTWEPEERRIAVGTPGDFGITRWEPAASHKAIVRSDTGLHLGTVGADWTPITHAVMGEMVEALLDLPNVKIETMVCLKEGRQVAATILVDEPYTLPGDDSLSLPYLVVLNALAEQLVALPAPADRAEQFLSEFIPRPPADVISDRVAGNIDTARETFRLMYEASPTCAANHGTALGLVHAAVEYLDHARTYRTRDTLVGRQILRAEPLKAKAVRIAQRVCG